MTYKEHIISFIQTALATFASAIGLAVSQVPLNVLGNIHTYTVSFFAAIIVSAVRTTIKIVWQNTLPPSVGGIPRD